MRRVDIQVCRDAARTNCQNNPGVLKYFIYVADVDPSHPTIGSRFTTGSQLTFEMLIGTESGRAYVIQAEKYVSARGWEPVSSPYIGFTGHTVLGDGHIVWVQSSVATRRVEMRVSATGHLGYRISIAEPDVAIIEQPTAALSSTRSATQGNVELPLEVRNSTNGEVNVDIEVDCTVIRPSITDPLKSRRYHGPFTVPSTTTSESNLDIGSICNGIVLKDDDDVSLSARLIDDDFRQTVAADRSVTWEHNTSSTLFDYQRSNVMGGLQMLIRFGDWRLCTSSFTLTLRNISSSSTYDAVSTTGHCSTTTGDDWYQGPISLAAGSKVADATEVADVTTCRMMLTTSTSTSRSSCTIGDQSYGEKPSTSTATFAKGYIFKPGTGSVGFDDALHEPEIQYYTGNASTDRFSIAGARPPLDGEVVHKVGRTTGWTEGSVRRLTKLMMDPTCPGSKVGTVENVPPNSSGYIECISYTEDMAAGGGDSGAPVFARIGTGSYVYLVGALYGLSDIGGAFIPIDRIYAESLRQGYDWEESDLRPIPSLDSTAELLAERAGTGSTRVITATFSRGDFSPSLYYKAELFRGVDATGDHCFVSIDKRHAKLGYDDESSTTNCSVTEGTGGQRNVKQIHVSFEGLTQIAGAYTVKLRACVRDASDDHQCGTPGSAGIQSVTMNSP